MSLYKLKILKNRKKNMPSYSPLVNGKQIPKVTAMKLAESGLALHHLKCAYKREGADGVAILVKDCLNKDTINHKDFSK